MRIQRTSLTTISPRAREELMYRKSATFHNAPRELRKPLGIYNASLFDIWESFIEVLDELDHVLDKELFKQPTNGVQWDKTLMRRQERLISDLMRHFDDCFNLLSCFYPKAHPTLEEDKKQMMKEPIIKAAMLAAKPYRDHIANVINHIKHQQGTLRGVCIFNDTKAIIGYFVEHVNQDESLEPHPKVHTLYQGQSTAFSFFRDLRYKFFLVYAVSEIVADAIIQLSRLTPSILNENKVDEKIAEIASRIALLPKWMFKDEIIFDFPQVDIEVLSGVTTLTIEYPSQSTILPALLGTYQSITGFIGDDVTDSIKPPYFSP